MRQPRTKSGHLPLRTQRRIGPVYDGKEVDLTQLDTQRQTFGRKQLTEPTGHMGKIKDTRFSAETVLPRDTELEDSRRLSKADLSRPSEPAEHQPAIELDY